MALTGTEIVYTYPLGPTNGFAANAVQASTQDIANLAATGGYVVPYASNNKIRFLTHKLIVKFLGNYCKVSEARLTASMQ